ncbi:MAG: YdcF family protein [Lachnospiraceae bacterium]|nr:YdcF family protein [Lachnospiraceae bacterium]
MNDRKEQTALLIIGILLLVIGQIVVVVFGGSYTLHVDVHAGTDNIDDYNISIDQKYDVIEIADKQINNGVLSLRIQSVSKGKAYIDIEGPDDYYHLESFYVHPFGVITVDNYFGESAGAHVIPVLAAIYLVLILLYIIREYNEGVKESLYQYKNIRNLGWIIYFSSLVLVQLNYVFSNKSLIETVRTTLDAASTITFIAFPIAFVVSVMVSISNIKLMRREGRNWRNMLGFFMGVLVCMGTILPNLLSEYLQRSTIVDVHNERGAALYIEMVVTNIVLVGVNYLECILLSTVILGFKAARKIPAFDKDYILILGCQIKKDGTVTPLLKGRADRALEFARMQEKATGKAPVFVPSGGRGEDEIISEAEAISNYLVEKGIAPDRILVENQSASTYENIRNSYELIKEHFGEGEPDIAFATTNYHVFRAGILANEQGVHAEGIGGKTRSYFWINAFVREFIATVYSERKKHAVIITVMTLLTLAMIFMVYLANTL